MYMHIYIYNACVLLFVYHMGGISLINCCSYLFDYCGVLISIIFRVSTEVTFGRGDLCVLPPAKRNGYLAVSRYAQSVVYLYK